MDYTAVIFDAFKGLWWLIPIVLLLGVLKSSWFKGLVGEALVKVAAKFRLPEEIYRPVHNVTLPTPDGTTQIDYLFVSRFGIFVVETKNMKGWIFGSEDQAQWTQKVYRKSSKFQNPLRQNYKHIKALEDILDVPEEAIHSVVVFMGSATLKTRMPENVTTGGGYVSYIKSFREVVLSEAQIQEALDKIRMGRLAPSSETHRQHVARIKARSGPDAERKCPKCGSSMVLRTAKRGASAGKPFWGCSAYPQCKVIQNIR